MKKALTHIQLFRPTLLLLLLLFSVSLATQAVAANQPEKDKLSVYIFLSETCPISQFYTITLKDLYREFDSDNLAFKGIFPNAESTVESVAEFKKTYDLPFELMLDTDQKLAKELKATVTPEVIIKNDVTGEILYQGRIDEAYYQVGKKRAFVRDHDLRDALSRIQNNQPVKKPKTDAVGCIITFLP